MTRHFEKEKMGAVVAEIDKMFSKRFDAMVSSLTLPRSFKTSLGGHGNGGARKPRHLH
jgi:hypothetical protein